MASVGSLSSSTSNSIRGYGGLASGLDRDELIKGMTLGTTSKLNQQEQKKQKIEWMQEAVRAISDKMISFHGKYTETLTSPTNLFSSLLWGRNKITTSGDNSKYVSISGTASGADAMTIMGIKQKAQNASLSSTGKPASTMTSESIDFSDVQTLKNQTLEFSYAGKDYKVLLNEGDYSTVDNAVSSIQNILNKTDVGEGKKLGDVIKVTRDGDAFKIEANEKIVGDKPTVLKGGTALEYMGIENKEVNFSDGTQGPVSSDTSKIDLEKTWAERVKGQTLTFSYNGTEAKIEIANDANTLEEVQKSLQKSLDAKFGKDRVSVDIKNKDDSGNAITPKLTFRTTIPGDGATKETDDSSILKVTGGNYETLSALGLRAGLSNRTNFDEKVDLSAFGPAEEKEIPVKDKDGNDTGETVKEYWYKFKLNGEDIQVRGDENGFATKKDLINAINNSNANVTVTYQEAADKFTFTSKVNGASGVIDFSKNSVDANNKLSEVFGLNRDKMNDSVRGQDAIVAVKYAGSDQEVELRRDSNTFTVDGLTIALKGEFGYKKNDAGELERDHSVDAVEINASVDVDKLMDTIKSFVADYNAIVDLVNGELTTKHDRDYDPLTSDQKAELSETEISKWETKAKEGLLYGDSDLRSLSMDLRVVVSGGLLVEFEKIGINLSSSYSDNGKLSIDESKLRAALETDPEKVQNLFTSKEGGIGADGKPTSNGLATNLKSVMDKYVKTVGSMETKGILIRKAGSKSAAQSLTQNTYYDQLTALDKLINQLKTRLKTEQDRYISQFSTLETMIANMNSQSSYLSSMGGY
ncbi:MAG: flagellar filament capping protein FliD [Ruminococcus sp.]|jgi:flagellar hook-associated protein 2|nr:flagellar filament capping protein FliD [Ruminococcus sp.]MCI9330324.1 flagellar filament capping protein FliD [Ruminococcus sp.]